MVPLLVELELYVEALLDADLHLDLLVVLLRLLLAAVLVRDVVDDKLFLLRDAIVVAVDHDVDEVAHAHIDAIVRLELLLHPVEREIVTHVVRERPRRLQVANKLREN